MFFVKLYRLAKFVGFLETFYGVTYKPILTKYEFLGEAEILKSLWTFNGCFFFALEGATFLSFFFFFSVRRNTTNWFLVCFLCAGRHKKKWEGFLRGVLEFVRALARSIEVGGLPYFCDRSTKISKRSANFFSEFGPFLTDLGPVLL